MFSGFGNFANNIKNGAGNLANNIKNGAVNTAYGIKNGAVNTAYGIKNGAVNTAYNIKNGAGIIANNAGTLGNISKMVLSRMVKEDVKTLKSGVEFVTQTAKKTTSAVSHFVTKWGGIIKPIACQIIRRLCKPACTAAATYFQAAGSTINVTFHVPAGCITDTLEAGCNKLCEVVCSRRRLAIRKL